MPSARVAGSGSERAEREEEKKIIIINARNAFRSRNSHLLAGRWWRARTRRGRTTAADAQCGQPNRRGCSVSASPPEQKQKQKQRRARRHLLLFIDIILFIFVSIL